MSNLLHLGDLPVQLALDQELGVDRTGQRRIIPIIGGTVTGPNISGMILVLVRSGKPYSTVAWQSWAGGKHLNPMMGS